MVCGDRRVDETVVGTIVIHHRNPFADDGLDFVDIEEGVRFRVDAARIDVWPFVAWQVLQQPAAGSRRSVRQSPCRDPSSTRTSRRSLLADLANLRAHNERLRHHNTKLTERLSEVLGEQVFHDAGLTPTDEIGTLRERVAKLEQQLLDQRHDLQDRDDELDAARATNRDLMTRLNSRTPTNEQACTTRVVHTT